MEKTEKLDCIVSLTSWKGRIYEPDVCKNLFSIIKQKTKYNYKIVLVLSIKEFPKKEEDLPEILRLFINNNLIEIIWTETNMKAYKKLHPTIEKYPDIPIMTTDDDIYLDDDIIETYMNLHKKYPNKILSEDGFYLSNVKPTIAICGWFRLFPPHSLRKANEFEFDYFYQRLEDDAYNGVLAYLNKTETIIKIKSGKCHFINNKFEKTALSKEYTKTNVRVFHKNFIEYLKKKKEI